MSFKDRTLSDAELDEYYRVVDFSKWESDRLFPTERAVTGFLRQQLPPGARVLDYGCSTGRMLGTLVGIYKCHGYEIDPRSANVAAARGLSMLSPSDLSDGRMQPFDAVVLMDVFEHLRRPSARLLELMELISPGGLLVVATGNADAPEMRRHPADCYYFRYLDHLCVLGRQYAECMSRRSGSELAHWQEVSHYDTPPHERLKQHLRNFAYWQTRRGTLFARWVLPWLPGTRRAGTWSMAPELNCCRDHVVVAWRKQA